jgi:hypothetical protein
MTQANRPWSAVAERRRATASDSEPERRHRLRTVGEGGSKRRQRFVLRELPPSTAPGNTKAVSRLGLPPHSKVFATTAIDSQRLVSEEPGKCPPGHPTCQPCVLEITPASASYSDVSTSACSSNVISYRIEASSYWIRLSSYWRRVSSYQRRVNASQRRAHACQRTAHACQTCADAYPRCVRVYRRLVNASQTCVSVCLRRVHAYPIHVSAYWIRVNASSIRVHAPLRSVSATQTRVSESPISVHGPPTHVHEPRISDDEAFRSVREGSRSVRTSRRIACESLWNVSESPRVPYEAS